MPRLFSLGSQQRSPQNDNNGNKKNPFLRLQIVKKDGIKTLWRRLRKNKSSTNDASPTTRDWRSLSPHEPPLPFISSITDSPTADNDVQIGGSSSSSSSSKFSRGKRIVPQSEWSPNRRTSSHFRQSTGSVEDRPYRELYPIMEESETIMSESSQQSTPPVRLSLVQNDEEDRQKRISTCSNGSNGNNNNGESDEGNQSTSSSSSTTSSSAVSYHPSPVWPTLQPKKEPHFRPGLVGDEAKCRRRFAKMVAAAYRFQLEHRTEIPKQMEIIFNAQDNVRLVKLSINGQTEYHRFCGNSQYIPPELTVHGVYNNALADVWVLGVSLYRMLVGKFPFIASNDRKLFKKMLNGDFSIPSTLSEDAKDLLRRMLAPDTTRASLDLVLFHPWLKPYKVTVPSAEQPAKEEHVAPDQPPVAMAEPSTTVAVRENLGPSQHLTTTGQHHYHEKRTSVKRALAHMIHLVVEGPFPPPRHPYRVLVQMGQSREQLAL